MPISIRRQRVDCILLATMYWIGKEPTPSGGEINRSKELKDHCAYFARAE